MIGEPIVAGLGLTAAGMNAWCEVLRWLARERISWELTANHGLVLVRAGGGERGARIARAVVALSMGRAFDRYWIMEPKRSN